MKSIKNNVVMNQLGVAGVPASGCSVRPWSAYVSGSGVHLAPMSASALELDSAVKTPVVAATTRKDANPFSTVARSGRRTSGPPV